MVVQIKLIVVVVCNGNLRVRYAIASHADVLLASHAILGSNDSSSNENVKKAIWFNKQNNTFCVFLYCHCTTTM